MYTGSLPQFESVLSSRMKSSEPDAELDAGRTACGDGDSTHGNMVRVHHTKRLQTSTDI